MKATMSLRKLARRAAVLALALAAALSVCAAGAAPARADGDRLVGKVVRIISPDSGFKCTMTYTYDYDSMTMKFVSEGGPGEGGYFEVYGVDTDVPVNAEEEAAGSFRVDSAGRIEYEEVAGAVPVFATEMTGSFLLAPAVMYTNRYYDDGGTQPSLTRTYDENGMPSALCFQTDVGQLEMTYEGGLPTKVTSREKLFSEGGNGAVDVTYPVVDTDESGRTTAMRVCLDGGETEGCIKGLFTYYDGEGRLLSARSQEASVFYSYGPNGTPEWVTAWSQGDTDDSSMSWEAQYDGQGRPLTERLILTGEDGTQAVQSAQYYYGGEGDTLDALIESQADEFLYFDSSYENSEWWLEPGYYLWYNGEMFFDPYTSYGEVYYQMQLFPEDTDELFRFRTKAVYPDGETCRLLADFASDPSEVESYGQQFTIEDNGDIVFADSRGIAPNGATVMGGETRFYYFGPGDYRTDNGERVYKLSAPLAQLVHDYGPYDPELYDAWGYYVGESDDGYDDTWPGSGGVRLEEGDPALEGMAQDWKEQTDHMVESFNACLGGDQDRLFDLIDDIVWSMIAIDQETTVQQLKDEYAGQEMGFADGEAPIASYKVVSIEQRDPQELMYFSPDELWEVCLETVDANGETGEFTFDMLATDGEWHATIMD